MPLRRRPDFCSFLIDGGHRLHYTSFLSKLFSLSGRDSPPHVRSQRPIWDATHGTTYLMVSMGCRRASEIRPLEAPARKSTAVCLPIRRRARRPSTTYRPSPQASPLCTINRGQPLLYCDTRGVEKPLQRWSFTPLPLCSDRWWIVRRRQATADWPDSRSSHRPYLLARRWLRLKMILTPGWGLPAWPVLVL